jgi:hypothetical protein
MVRADGDILGEGHLLMNLGEVYAGLRPGEAVELRIDHSLDIPATDDWGTPSFESRYQRSAPPGQNPAAPATPASSSTEPRKKSAQYLATRHSPAIWTATSINTAPSPDGRLFRGERGSDLSESVYGRAWQGARLLAFTPPIANSPLARRAYELRHACLSTWLNAGVEPTQAAGWAGNSVQVLFKVYAKCIAGRDQANRRRRRRIEEAFRDDELGR